VWRNEGKEGLYLRIAACIKVLGSHNHISRELPVGREDGNFPRNGSGSLGMVACDHAKEREGGREGEEERKEVVNLIQLPPKPPPSFHFYPLSRTER